MFWRFASASPRPYAWTWQRAALKGSIGQRVHDAYPGRALYPAGRGEEMAISTYPLTPDRWPDVEKLFGAKGALGGCWCMWWQQTGKEYEAGKGEGNRRAFEAEVEAGPPPGVIAYANGEPVGWCRIGPRGSFARLQRARTLKPVDERPAWSVVCFYVAKDARGQGVTDALLKAATDYAASMGAELIEAYPRDPKPGPWAAAEAFRGRSSLYERGGFSAVPRPAGQAKVMRRELEKQG
jgi:GNAT superfamily N-acetyltransferase